MWQLLPLKAFKLCPNVQGSFVEEVFSPVHKVELKHGNGRKKDLGNGIWPNLPDRRTDFKFFCHESGSLLDRSFPSLAAIQSRRLRVDGLSESWARSRCPTIIQPHTRAV